jgi:hypothetical protein
MRRSAYLEGGTDGAGFEPARPFRAHTLSRRAHGTSKSCNLPFFPMIAALSAVLANHGCRSLPYLTDTTTDTTDCPVDPYARCFVVRDGKSVKAR